ncbi:UGSC family (seleno)protein [Sphingomonas sp. YL-JM2C]
MEIAETSVRYLDPGGETAVPALPYRARLDPAREAPVIALFSNLFVDATIFLEDVGEALHRLIPGASFRRYDKGVPRNASFPAPAELIGRIRAECDAVVLAYGHCGSCTAGLARDAAMLARAGMPLAPLVTHKFDEEARFIAHCAGVSDIPFVVLPHPIAGEATAYHRTVARAAAPAIVAAWRMGIAARIDQADLAGLAGG